MNVRDVIQERTTPKYLPNVLPAMKGTTWPALIQTTRRSTFPPPVRNATPRTKGGNQRNLKIMTRNIFLYTAAHTKVNGTIAQLATQTLITMQYLPAPRVTKIRKRTTSTKKFWDIPSAAVRVSLVTLTEKTKGRLTTTTPTFH